MTFNGIPINGSTRSYTFLIGNFKVRIAGKTLTECDFYSTMNDLGVCLPRLAHCGSFESLIVERRMLYIVRLEEFYSVSNKKRLNEAGSHLQRKCMLTHCQ